MPRKLTTLQPTNYKGLVALMARGLLDCELCSELDCSEKDFQEYLKNPLFLKAYEKGLPKAETFYIQQYKLELQEDKPNKEKLKVYENILDKRFKWARKDIDNISTQININSLTVNQNKNRIELIEYIQDELIDQGLVDGNSVESREFTEAEYQLVESKQQD